MKFPKLVSKTAHCLDPHKANNESMKVSRQGRAPSFIDRDTICDWRRAMGASASGCGGYARDVSCVGEPSGGASSPAWQVRHTGRDEFPPPPAPLRRGAWDLTRL